MKKIALALTCLGLVAGFSYAQTCTGSIAFDLVDASGTPVTSAVTVSSIAYHTTTASGTHIVLHESKLSNAAIMGWEVLAAPTLTKGNPNNNARTTDIEFNSHCNVYLTQMTLTKGAETMKVGFYNLPDGSIVEVGNITFEPGEFSVDLAEGANLVAMSKGKYKVKDLVVMSFGNAQNLGH